MDYVLGGSPSLDDMVGDAISRIQHIQRNWNDDCQALSGTLMDDLDSVQFYLDEMCQELKESSIRIAYRLVGSAAKSMAAEAFGVSEKSPLLNLDETLAPQDADVGELDMAADSMKFLVVVAYEVVESLMGIVSGVLDMVSRITLDMVECHQEHSQTCIQAVGEVGNRFLKVIGEVSSRTDSGEAVNGLLDFIGKSQIDEGFTKDVVGTANRTVTSMIGHGKDVAEKELTAMLKGVGKMFNGSMGLLEEFADKFQNAIDGIIGEFHVTATGLEETTRGAAVKMLASAPTMAIGKKSRMPASRDWQDTVNDREKSQTSMDTDYWRGRLADLESARDNYFGEGSENPGSGAGKDENMDATIQAMKTAIESGKSEDAAVAMNLYQNNTEVSQTIGAEDKAMSVILARNNGVQGAWDDGENPYKSLSKEQSINNPFWKKVADKEGHDSEIGQAILNAIETQDPNDIGAACKLMKDKYGPLSKVGDAANLLGGYKGGQDFWTEQDYKGIKLRDILGTDLVSQKAQDMIKELVDRKDKGEKIQSGDQQMLDTYAQVWRELDDYSSLKDMLAKSYKALGGMDIELQGLTSEEKKPILDDRHEFSTKLWNFEHGLDSAGKPLFGSDTYSSNPN